MTPSFPSSESVRRHFCWLGMAYLAMTAAFTAVAYIMQYAALLWAPALLGTRWFPWAVSLLPLYGVGLPVLWLFLRRVPASPHNSEYALGGTVAEKPAFGPGQWCILLVISFGCMTAGGLAGNLIMAVLSELMQYDYAFALNSMVADTPVWFTFLCTCVCAPFGEELIFRKLLIDRTRRYGDLTAILLSGLLFGLFHGNLFQFFYAAAVGMVLAYVYTRSGSYLWCVAMHAAINFMGSVITPALTAHLPADLSSPLTPAARVIYIVLLLWQYGMLIAGIALFRRCYPRRKLSPGCAGGAPIAEALANPGMLACMIIMLALVIVNLVPAR